MASGPALMPGPPLLMHSHPVISQLVPQEIPPALESRTHVAEIRDLSPTVIPVAALTLGVQTYTKAELLALLNKSVNGDASLILALQLIAAKLNYAAGAPALVSATITHADSLLSSYSGKLPYQVKSGTAAGQAMASDGKVLEQYNTGVLTPGCGGGLTARATLADYDRDGVSDLVLWSPEAGVWHIRQSRSDTVQTVTWGARGDVPVLGDYDGDGKTDLAVYRQGTWYVRRSRDGAALVRQWGAADDVPVPGDYDGDGVTDLAVWRGAEGHWYIQHSADQRAVVTAWGASAAPYFDVPVTGDFDGDGLSDLAVFRRATGAWYIRQSSDGQARVQAWGLGTDVPVAGDYDGDGATDIAVWRPQTGTWFVWRSGDGGFTVRAWGAGVVPYNDVPAPGDYDGDGLCDLTVWRPGSATWLVLRSDGQGTLSKPQGQTGDRPVK